MTAVAITIQHHPSRTAMLSQLQSRLAEINAPSPVIAADDGCGANEAFRRSLRPPAGPAWLVRLEDDCWPCHDFTPRLQSCLAVRGCWMLYCTRKAVRQAAQRGEPSVRVRPSEMYSAVGLALPADVLPRLLVHYDAWLARYEGLHRYGFDLAIADFCRTISLPIFAAAPPLVQHRDPRSLLGHPRGRRSAEFDAAYPEDIPLC